MNGLYLVFHRDLDGMQMVAALFADNLETVFHMTNHVDEDWTENKLIQLFSGNEHRSTSVGDVVIGPDGTAWKCCSAGWEAIGEFNADPYELLAFSVKENSALVLR
jgi:hypothetical protein